MELPNNIRVACVIADAVEALNALCDEAKSPRLTAAQVASLWKRREALHMLDIFPLDLIMPHGQGDDAMTAFLVTFAKARGLCSEMSETFESMFLAYAFHLRGDKDEENDYATVRAFVQTRAERGAQAGVVPRAIVSAQAEGA